MMRKPVSLIGMLLVAVITTAALPAWAQTEGEARLGGGSDIPPETTVRLPQGGSIPAVHTISADNPGTEEIRVEFRAEAAAGIMIDPEWDTETIPAEGSVVNHFAVEVAPSIAPGEYPVVIQLVRSDIESEPGRITNIPAIQATFTVEVVGESAAVTVRSVSAHSGEPVTATITLSARLDDRGWFEIDRTQDDTLDARVAPGEYRAAVLVGEREVAAEEFTVEADQALDVEIEVETVSFVVAAARPVTERGRLVVVELVASVNNETDAIPGPNRLQAIVSHGGVEVDTVTLDELSQVPAGITEATVTYRPEGGWQQGTYRFAFTLVTPAFTLTAPDQPVLEVPAMGFDLLAFIATLDTREAIALAAAAVLALLLVERLIRFLLRRRRQSATGPTRRERRAAHAETRQPGRNRRRKNPSPPEPEPSWLEEPIGPVTAGRSQWDDDNPDEDDPDNDSSHSSPSPPDRPSNGPVAPATPATPATPPPPRGSHVAPREQAIPEPQPTQPISPGITAGVPSGNSSDMAHMVEALRVVQRLHDEGSLAPGWSITDATLVYWAMISPGVHESLGAVGMTEEEYGTAMRRLFTHGLLGRSRLPRDASNG